MTIPDEVKELHRSLSRRAVELLATAEAEPAARLPVEDARYPYRLQSWPTYLGPAALAAVERAALAVPALVRAIPERLFGNDARRLTEFYGLPNEALAGALVAPPNGMAGALSRGDFVATADGFRCVELNMSAILGGWEVRTVVADLLARPWLVALERRSGSPAHFRDPLAALFAHIADEAERASLTAGGELNLALLLPPRQPPEARAAVEATLGADFARFLASRERPLGGALLLATPEQIKKDRAGVGIGGRRIHALLEYYQPAAAPVFFRAFKAGEVLLYNGPAASFLLADKRNLALLSESVESDAWDAAERAAIRASIPWTRVARQGTTEFRGELVDLAALVRERRPEMVLKHARGTQGDSVHLGANLPEAEWRERVERALSGDAWIVQERLASLPYWYQQGADGAGPHDAVWGLFAFGGRYGGGTVRVMPQGGDGVVNAARGASEGLLLEVDEEEA